MEVQIQSFDAYRIVSLVGTFSEKEIMSLKHALEAASRSKIDYLLLDCKEVSQVTPAALRWLLPYVQVLKEKRIDLIMYHLSPEVLTLVTSCAFDSLVTVAPSLQKALQIVKTGK